MSEDQQRSLEEEDLSSLEGEAHPLDSLEQLFRENAWPFSRPCSDTFIAITSGECVDYRLAFEWQKQARVLALVCAPELDIPVRARGRLLQVLHLVNLELWLGHFECLDDPLRLQFRYGIPLFVLAESDESSDASTNGARIGRLLEHALGVCERYAPAFLYAIRQKKALARDLTLAVRTVEGHA